MYVKRFFPMLAMVAIFVLGCTESPREPSPDKIKEEPLILQSVEVDFVPDNLDAATDGIVARHGNDLSFIGFNGGINGNPITIENFAGFNVGNYQYVSLRGVDLIFANNNTEAAIFHKVGNSVHKDFDVDSLLLAFGTYFSRFNGGRIVDHDPNASLKVLIYGSGTVTSTVWQLILEDHVGIAPSNVKTDGVPISAMNLGNRILGVAYENRYAYVDPGREFFLPWVTKDIFFTSQVALFVHEGFFTRYALADGAVKAFGNGNLGPVVVIGSRVFAGTKNGKIDIYGTGRDDHDLLKSHTIGSATEEVTALGVFDSGTFLVAGTSAKKLYLFRVKKLLEFELPKSASFGVRMPNSPQSVAEDN